MGLQHKCWQDSEQGHLAGRPWVSMGVLFIDVSVKSLIIFHHESGRCFCASRRERSMSTFASGIMEQQYVDRYWPDFQTSSRSRWRWVERIICTQAATDLFSCSAAVQRALRIVIAVFSCFSDSGLRFTVRGRWHLAEVSKCCTKRKPVRRRANEPRRQLLLRVLITRQQFTAASPSTRHHCHKYHSSLKWTLVWQGRELWYYSSHYALQTHLLTPQVQCNKRFGVTFHFSKVCCHLKT